MTKIFNPGDLIIIKEAPILVLPRGKKQSNIVVIIAFRGVVDQTTSYGFREYYESYAALHEYKGLIELKMLTLNKTKNCGLIVVDPNDKNHSKHGRYGNFVTKLN